MLTRREFIPAAVAGAVHGAEPARPNIIFIYTDDQRWDAMGCAGHPFLKTPNIDRIAHEGAWFPNFFCTTPLCCPSRASFLTGRYAHGNGVKDNQNNNALSHRLVTWPRLLHDVGYETAFIGKWHMGDDATPRPGFDRWVSFGGQGIYQNPPLNVDGKNLRAQGYMTDILTGHAVEFLKRKRTRPFVLYLGHKAPHEPFTPAERHKNLYTNDILPHRPSMSDTFDGKPALKLVEGQRAGRQASRSMDELVRNQLRTLMAVDEGVGEIFKALEATGQLSNTVIAYSSDNGYFWGEHSLRDKRWAYEESIRIPLVMSYPKLIRPGSKIASNVMNIDIAPTMLELGGAKVPANVHGSSVVPLMRGATANWRPSFLAEYFAEEKDPTPGWHAVRTADWKYIQYTELKGMDELYHISADPFEMKNVINDPAAGQTLKNMKADLARLQKQTA